MSGFGFRPQPTGPTSWQDQPRFSASRHRSEPLSGTVLNCGGRRYRPALLRPVTMIRSSDRVPAEPVLLCPETACAGAARGNPATSAAAVRIRIARMIRDLPAAANDYNEIGVGGGRHPLLMPAQAGPQPSKYPGFPLWYQ